MASPTPRNLALQALNYFHEKGILPRYFLEQSFRRYPGISGRDKALCVHLTNGVLRWRLKLDWYIEQSLNFPFGKIELRVLNILRIALYQIFFMDRIPPSAAVNEAVKQAKAEGRPHVARFVNGLLRGIIRKRNSLKPFPENVDQVERLSVEHSYPKWLVRKWITELGEAHATSLLKASNKIPNLVIRVNSQKVTRHALIERLAKQGISASATLYSPAGIQIDNLNVPITELDEFREGLFQVQSEAAQVCSFLLNPSKGDEVLEVCAGIGGKATHLAEMVGPQGRVIGLDIKRGSLVRLGQACKRLGISCVYPVCGDATKPLDMLFKNRFQRVLVDSPCSGLGVISRHPDIKWVREKCHIPELSKAQSQILAQASRILRPGGLLLYITCTISREENEAVVKNFLEEHPEMDVVDLREKAPCWAKGLVDEDGFFRTWPDVHGLDGFFGAMLVKR